MSIGGSFGQREEDDSEAFTDVVNFGVVSIISAGNDGDIPYIVASPSATPEVVAVAATNSVVAEGIPLVVNSPASIAGAYANTATLDFAPISGTVTAKCVLMWEEAARSGSIGTGVPQILILTIRAGRSCPGRSRGDNRAVSLKIDRAASAGAVGVLIGLVAPGDAVAFSNGGGSNFVPTLRRSPSPTSTLIIKRAPRVAL